MCMEDNGKRMLSWDIVKGITILIMIVGHVASIPQQLRNFIFSFQLTDVFSAEEESFCSFSENIRVKFVRSDSFFQRNE